MLKIARKPGQSFQISENITVTIRRFKGQSVIVGIEAPPEVKILRDDAFKK